MHQLGNVCWFVNHPYRLNLYERPPPSMPKPATSTASILRCVPKCAVAVLPLGVWLPCCPLHPCFERTSITISCPHHPGHTFHPVPAAAFGVSLRSGDSLTCFDNGLQTLGLLLVTRSQGASRTDGAPHSWHVG